MLSKVFGESQDKGNFPLFFGKACDIFSYVTSCYVLCSSICLWSLHTFTLLTSCFSRSCGGSFFPNPETPSLAGVPQSSIHSVFFLHLPQYVLSSKGSREFAEPVYQVQPGRAVVLMFLPFPEGCNPHSGWINTPVLQMDNSGKCSKCFSWVLLAESVSCCL